jgi:predicted PurR-regulated permease PerM
MDFSGQVIMSRMLSIVVLFAILVAIGVLFFRVMSIFIVPAFLAALLGVLFQPLYHRFQDRLGRDKSYFASGLTVFAILLMVLVPAGVILFLAAVEGVALVDTLRDVSVRDKLAELRTDLDLDIPHEADLRRIDGVLARCSDEIKSGRKFTVDDTTLDNLVTRTESLDAFVKEHQLDFPNTSAEKLLFSMRDLREQPIGTVGFDQAVTDANREFKRFKLSFLGGPYRAWLRELANPDEEQIEQLRNGLVSTSRSPLLAIGAGTLSIVGRTLFSVIVMLTTLFFIFADGPWIMDELLRVSPLEERYVRELIREFDQVSRAVVMATLLAAVVQGLLAGVGFWFFGVGSVFLLTLLTTLLALIPFLGAASVWIPVAVWLYLYQGRLDLAIGMTLYGVLVISLVDNLIKPLVLHGQSKLHPLLAAMSVLGGVQALGPIGILIGPMAVVFLQTLAKILHREYKSVEGKVGEAAEQDAKASEKIKEAGDHKAAAKTVSAKSEPAATPDNSTSTPPPSAGHSGQEPAAAS